MADLGGSASSQTQAANHGSDAHRENVFSHLKLQLKVGKRNHQDLLTLRDVSTGEKWFPHENMGELRCVE